MASNSVSSCQLNLNLFIVWCGACWNIPLAILKVRERVVGGNKKWIQKRGEEGEERSGRDRDRDRGRAVM